MRNLASQSNLHALLSQGHNDVQRPSLFDEVQCWLAEIWNRALDFLTQAKRRLSSPAA